MKQKSYTIEEVKSNNCNYEFNARFQDLTGKTFDDLTVIKLKGREGNHTMWFCRCNLCGKIIVHPTNVLHTRKGLAYTECKTRKRLIAKRLGLIAKLKEKYPNVDVVHYSIYTPLSIAWDLHCNECNVAFKGKVAELISGKSRLMCLCGSISNEPDTKKKVFLYATQEMQEAKILEICKKNNTEFLGWEDGYKTQSSRINLKCLANNNHPVWNIKLANYLRYGYKGCPRCSKLQRSAKLKHTLAELIEKGTELHNNKFDYSEYVYHDSRTPSGITCRDCGCEFSVSFDNHINKKRGCPQCYGRSQKEAYILNIIEGDQVIGLKYGIANNTENRFRDHCRCSKYKLEIFGVWQFDKYLDCRQAESNFKANSYGSFLTYDEFPSGCTETVEIRYLSQIIETYEKHNGERIR